MEKRERTKKKLSIIIPYYKTYELTNNLLKGLIPQLTDEIEVLLIDDGCNEKRLDKYTTDITIIHLEKNVGGATATNVGIDKAIGEYIGFIDSDDMISNNYIYTLLQTIRNHNEDVIIFDWQDMGTYKIMHHPNNYAPWKAIYKWNIIPKFPDGQKFSYDVPFYHKLNSKPYTKYYIDEVLYYYNSQREDNLTHLKEIERRKNMIKCEVIEKFTLERFDELVDLERKAGGTKPNLYVGDVFKCEKELADYLLGNNPKNKTVVKLIEVDPEPEVTEQEVQAVAEAIVEEALESKKSIEQVVQEINDEIEQQPKPKKKKTKKK